MNGNDPTKTLYSDPPFSAETQLNDELLDSSLIPGEYIPLSTASDFLHNSLSQEKANAIFRHLWFAGTPRNFRALHEQSVFRRKIIPCEDPSLHLIWFNEAIYMKPLPPCLMNYEFFKQHICPSKDLFTLACGLLYSYTHLVRYESDFRIAVKIGLIRGTDLTWEKWQAYRLSLKSFLDIHPSTIDRRYRYGELRLSRLNAIFALKLFRFIGYHNAYTQYAPYFSRYFAGAILIFAFASVTLNAMQVATQQVQIDLSPKFISTCYRFSIAILVAVVTITALLTAVFIPIVIYDLRSGLIANKKIAKDLRRTQA
jgi:hypothetical protein